MKFGSFFAGAFAFVLMLHAMGCNSHHASKAEPVSSSDQSPASAQSQSKPADETSVTGNPNEPPNISYSKDPGKFAKMPIYEPPFNIKDPKTAQEHFNVAVNDDHTSRLDQAILEYKKALEMQPDWAIAHYRLAVDYQKLGRIDDAISEWEQTTRSDPQFYSAYDLLAGAYQRKGNTRKAIDVYSKLLKYPPLQMPVHYQLGFLYEEIGDREQAENHLENYRNLALKTSQEPKSDRFQKALHEIEKLKQQS